MSRNRIPLAIASWLSFAITLTLYWITADPGASYWDCPEYVTVASKMEVGHPPGNPIWMLAMRVATIPFSPQNHAYVVNLCSGLFMAFAVFFLCRLIYLPTRFFLGRQKFCAGLSKTWKDFSAGVVALGASLCFGLCDSAWYSAVEAEVYALSTFLSALSLWIMALWWMEKSRGRQLRLLILLAYILGLSLGVHQLNLLLIPVFAVIILYKSPRKVSPVKVLIVFIASVALIGFILLGLMPGVLFGAGKFELWAVNGLALPYNSGVLIFSALLFILFLIFIYLTTNYRGSDTERYPLSGLCLWASAFLLLGYSSFLIILIRGNAHPPMNEGAPDNIFALASYIARDQYPSTPLIYGQTPYSQPVFQEEIKDGHPIYARYALKKGKPKYHPMMPDVELDHRSRLVTTTDSINNQNIIEKGHGYLLADYDFKQELTPELNMWLPRITSRNIADRTAYMDWAGASEETMLYIPVSEAVDSAGVYHSKMDGEGQRIPKYSYRPTYYQNLKFFVAYQAYYMYFRYLFWNFIGRQNDYPAMGEIEHGNIISGIPYIDSTFLGVTSAIPSEIWEDNPGRNRYFGIPFIIGILGIIALAAGGRRSRRMLTVVTVIFLMTGLAIVAYLNQTPGEPRERDYTFLVSYMAFAMWIGAGCVALIHVLSKIMTPKYAAVIGMLISLGTPALMAAENFRDHDRRGRFETTFYASSLLDFELPSIIFIHGDNLTFPLWYATEVLDPDTHHTPVDISYLATPWYVSNLKKQGPKGISTIGKTAALAYGKYLLTRIPADASSSPMPLNEALEAMYDSGTAEWPTSLIQIPAPDGELRTINLHDFSKGSSYLPFKSLILLDILASEAQSSSPRTLYFPYAIDYSFYKPLEPVLTPTLFGGIYSPRLTDSIGGKILENAMKRELGKLSDLNRRQGSLTAHYSDPMTADHTRRYRGEMVIAANLLINRGNYELAQAVADSLLKILPYETLSPGDFTQTDSTFYEGREMSKLLRRLAISSDSDKNVKNSEKLDSLMRQRNEEWLRYYRSLPASQRQTLSNRSLRLLKSL